jgi:hypothetical protein
VRVVLLSLLLLAAAPAAAATAPTLVAHVVLAAPEPQCGPTTCAQPARGIVVRFRSGAGRVRSATTDKAGTLRAALPPGTYAVSTARTEEDPEATISPRRVVVRRAAVTRLTFLYRPGTP